MKRESRLSITPESSVGFEARLRNWVMTRLSFESTIPNSTRNYVRLFPTIPAPMITVSADSGRSRELIEASGTLRRT